jgi:hypothetical protein
MLEAKALQLILETNKKANSAEVLKIPGDGRTQWVRIGDELREIPVKPRPREHFTLSLDSMIDYVKVVHGSDFMADFATLPVLWHGDESIVFIPNDTDRRDRVSMQLKPTKRYTLLQKLEAEKPLFDQYAFIKLLRLELGLDPLFVGKFRKLSWGEGSRTDREHNHAADKLGKTINLQIENAADIPEEFDLQVPVYDEFPNELMIVKCAIEIDTRNQRLMLCPLPNELDKAMKNTQQFIHEWLTRELAECNVPVYYGTP